MTKHAIAVAVTNDDTAAGDAAELRKVHAFQQRFGVPCSYFVIPFNRETGAGISSDPALLDAIREVCAAGSEVHPHSYTHNLFEWGYPEIVSAMEFSREACEAFADSRFAIEAYQAKEAMQRRLSRVVEEWQRAVQEPPRGFRSGWGSFSGTLYEVLCEQGFRWASVRFASRTPWLWCKRGEEDEVYPESINDAVGLRPFRQNGIVEFPILGDYGFHTFRSRKESLVELFKRQFAACVDAAAPCVLVHHPHGLDAQDADPESGYEIYGEIFSWLAESGLARFVTMSRLYEEWRDKAMPAPLQVMPEMG